MTAAVEIPDDQLHAAKSDSESSEESLEAKRIRCIPSRSRKRVVSQYSRSVASSSPPKRPQSARGRNSANVARTGSPVGLGSPPKPTDGPHSRHRRARSWVPNFSSKKEAAVGTFEDHCIAELDTIASEMQDDPEKATKTKRGWHSYWGWSRSKDASTAIPIRDEDDEGRDQGSAVAEASPASVPIQDAKVKRGASKYLWPFSSKLGDTKNSTLDGVLSETDTVNGGEASADELTVESSRPSSRHNMHTGGSKDGKEEKDDKEEKSKEKKGLKHRRGNSIMELFKFKSVEGTTEGAEDSPGKPAGKKVDSTQTGYKTSSLSCFGMPQVVDDDEAVVEIIIEGLTCGRAGMRNLGNTCFINAALQCLRATPGLLENIAQDLMQDPSQLPSNLLECEADADMLLQSPTSDRAGSASAADAVSNSPNSVLIHASRPASPLATSTSAATSAPDVSAGKAALTGGAVPAESSPSLAQPASDTSPLRASSPSAAATGSSGGLASRVGGAPMSTHGSQAGSKATSPIKNQHRSPPASLCTSAQLCTPPVATSDAAAGEQLAGGNAAFAVHTLRAPGAGVGRQQGPVDCFQSFNSHSTATLHEPGILVGGKPAPGAESALHATTGGAVDNIKGAAGAGPGEAPAGGPALDKSQSELGTCSGEGSRNPQDAGTVGAGEEECNVACSEKEQEGEDGRVDANGEGFKAGEAVKEAAVEVTNADLATHLVQAMVRVATGQDSDVIVPQKFCQDMAHNALGGQFSDGGQHDSHEFLRYVMNVLHEAYDRVKDKPPYQEFVEVPEEPPAAKAARLWEEQQARESSPLSDVFQGQLESCVVCSKCQSTFHTYEPFMDLSLSLNKEGKGFSSIFKGKTIEKLEDCFLAFTEDEKLDGNESFWCSICDARTSATKVLRIHRFPRALVLHIKRFKMAARQHVKLSSNVAIPLQALDLAPFASESAELQAEGAVYDLYALANHSGSVDSGHYTAHVKVLSADDSQPWYLFADDRVQEVETDDVVSSEAYMMFYVRRPHPPASADGASL